MKLHRSEEGAALVELAFVLPVLLLLLLGIIDYGRYAYDAIVASNAARAGVEYGAQNLVTASDMTGQQNAALGDAQNLAGLTASPSPTFCMSGGAVVACTTSGASYYVEVTTTGVFKPWVKWPLLPATVTVDGSATMRVEEQ